VVLFNQTAVLAEGYVGRLSVSAKRVTLHAVRMKDEGSFTVLDRDGKIRRRNCLNVRGEDERAAPRCFLSASIDSAISSCGRYSLECDARCRRLQSNLMRNVMHQVTIYIFAVTVSQR